MSKLFQVEIAQPLSINRKSLSESLSRVSVLSSEKFRGVRIITSDNSINISANNPEKEQAEESVACTYGGEPMDIAFQCKLFTRNTIFNRG